VPCVALIVIERPFASGMTACPAQPMALGGLMVAPAGGALAAHAPDTIASSQPAAANLTRPRCALIATPALDDPNFRRTVVLILDHGDPGALGVVLNRPTGVAVDELLAPWADQAGLAPPATMFTGGPVAGDAVIGLARAVGGEPDPSPDWHRIIGPVATVDLTVPPDEQPVPLGGARLFAGYAGWSAGQLEAEVDDGGWFVMVGVADDAFAAAPERLWHDVLRRQGGRLALLAAYPPNPAVN